MIHEVCAVLLVVGLFLLGVISPGPNFLIVAERSIASGFRAGFAAGLGVATGDAIYAAAGLLGLATLVTRAGWLFAAVKVLGGLYIAWIGLSMIRRSGPGTEVPPSARGRSLSAGRSFRLGLLTDLSNPKTVVFFASIFATAYDPSFPLWVGGCMWGGIVGSSVLWRTGLALALSRRRIQGLYHRFRRRIERLFGVLLLLFGVRLAVAGRAQ
jgi:amino acid exporter